VTKIRMIGMDFDHTLIDHNQAGPRVPEATKALLYDLIAEGVEVGIVSGRQWWAMRDLLECQGIPWGKPFPTFFVTREAFLYWVHNGEMEPDREWNEARAEEMEELAQAIMRHAPQWFAAIKEAKLHVTGWTLWGDYGFELRLATLEEAERARKILQAHIEGWQLARAQRNRFLAHVALATAGKGRTLLRAAEVKGFHPHQVLAIGDSLNDLDMLDGALGLRSGAVGNAEEAVKQVVRRAGGVIASRPAGEGVIEIIAAYQEQGLL